MKTTMLVPTKVEFNAGPALSALPERQRNFCIAYMGNGGNGADAARIAGYSDVGDAARVRGSELTRNPRIKAAMKELGDAAFVAMAPSAIATIDQIRGNPQHPKQFDAAKYVLTQAGFHEQRDLNVNVSMTADEEVQAILRLAQQSGKDPREMLGPNAVDVEFEDITDEVVVDGESY